MSGIEKKRKGVRSVKRHRLTWIATAILWGGNRLHYEPGKEIDLYVPLLIACPCHLILLYATGGKGRVVTDNLNVPYKIDLVDFSGQESSNLYQAVIKKRIIRKSLN